MDLMGFDLSWDTLAILKKGMRIHYVGVDPKRYLDCTELLPRIVVFERNTQAPLDLNCTYCRSNTKAWSSLHLPAEAMARRKTVFKVQCLRELSQRFIRRLRRLTKASRTIPRSHWGRTGVNLGLCNS